MEQMDEAQAINDAHLQDQIARIQSQKLNKKSREYCAECGCKIPLGRQMATNGTTHCVTCAD